MFQDYGMYKPINSRKLRLNTCKQFDYRVDKVDGEILHYASYRNPRGEVVACRRYLTERDFMGYWMKNSAASETVLFGQHWCQHGGKRLVIAEGEMNAMTIAQAFNLSWPVVAYPRNFDGAVDMVKRSLEWASSFKEIVLAPVQDTAGRELAEVVAMLFPPGRVKVMDYGSHLDANTMLCECADLKDIGNKVFQAKPFRPDGIVMGADLWDDIMSEPPTGYEIPYPLLNQMLQGVRTGRIYMLTAGSGIGKSTYAHEIAYHLMKQHDQKVGCMGLEETRKRLAERYVAMALDKQIHITREHVTEDELKAAFDSTINSESFCIYDHRGSKDIKTICSKIRHMVVGLGMQWIVLDHISIVVSGLEEGGGNSERKTIDLLMTELSTMVEELEFGLIAIVHLKRKGNNHKSYNDGGTVSLQDLRGSGGLEQLSHTVIALERDQQDEAFSNYSRLKILKDRDLGVTGYADVLHYNPQTGRLLASKENPFADQAQGKGQTSEVDWQNSEF